MRQPERLFAFRLAALLRMTVDELGQRMSSEEFGLWQAYFEQEGMWPAAQYRRHAEILAAIYNGAAKPPSGRRSWQAHDFMPLKPWAQPASEEEQAAAPTVAAIEGLFGALGGRA